MKAIDAQFETSDKALASTLMARLLSMKIIGVKRYYETHYGEDGSFGSIEVT